MLVKKGAAGGFTVWKHMMGPGQNCNHGYDHGSALTDYKTCYGKADRRYKTVLSAHKIDQIDASYAADLFRQLGEGGDGGLAYAVKITVDAGVYACHGNGEGNDAKQRRGTLLQKKRHGDLICVQIDCQGAGDGKRHGQQKTGPECAEGIFIVPRACFICHIFGNGSLNAGHREGEGKSKHRGNELIDAHAFRAENIGKKDTIKKADKAAD